MARKPEQRAWDTFSGSLDRRQIRPMRVENIIGNGTPDVLAINRFGVVFWIENKALDGWPARAMTKPLKGKFEPGQLAFGREWRHWNGFAYVLLRVGLDYYLLSPDWHLDEMTTAEIKLHAIQQGKVEIIEYLQSLRHPTI